MSLDPLTGLPEPRNMTTSNTELAALASDIKDAIRELARGANYPDLLAAVDQLADALESKAEPVAWQDPETSDVITDGRKREWATHYGLGGASKAATYTVPLGKIAAPVQPEKDERKPSTCVWTYEEEPTYAWHTGCGNLWAFTDGGPEDNGTKFCPYCGGSVGIGSSTEEIPHE